MVFLKPTWDAFLFTELHSMMIHSEFFLTFDENICKKWNLNNYVLLECILLCVYIAQLPPHSFVGTFFIFVFKLGFLRYKVWMIEDCTADRTLKRHNAILDLHADYTFKIIQSSELIQRFSNRSKLWLKNLSILSNHKVCKFFSNHPGFLF